MADSIAVTRENETTHGAYKAPVPGSSREAELTWGAPGDTRIANHTYVPRRSTERGIAAALVDALIEDARKEGFKIEPSCSYVEAAFRRHRGWADLRAAVPGTAVSAAGAGSRPRPPRRSWRVRYAVHPAWRRRGKPCSARDAEVDRGIAAPPGERPLGDLDRLELDGRPMSRLGASQPRRAIICSPSTAWRVAHRQRRAARPARRAPPAPGRAAEIRALERRRSRGDRRQEPAAGPRAVEIGRAGAAPVRSPAGQGKAGSAATPARSRPSARRARRVAGRLGILRQADQARGRASRTCGAGCRCRP